MVVGGSRHSAISCGIAVNRVSVARRPPVLRWRSRPPIPPRIPVRSRPDGWQRACTYAPIASKFLGDGSRCLHHLRVACRPVTRCNPRRRAVAPTRPEPHWGSFLEAPSAAASVGHERSVVAALGAVSTIRADTTPRQRDTRTGWRFARTPASAVIGPMRDRRADHAVPDEGGGHHARHLSARGDARCRPRGPQRITHSGPVDGSAHTESETSRLVWDSVTPRPFFLSTAPASTPGRLFFHCESLRSTQGHKTFLTPPALARLETPPRERWSPTPAREV
ncbi:MAG: hypothetical protein RL354_685 [Planctomycetota bacterium]